MSSLRAQGRRRCLAMASGLWASLLISAVSAQEPPSRPAVQIDSDGTVTVPAHAVPISEFLSPAARAYLRDHLKPDPSLLQGGGADNGIPPLIAGYLKRQQQLFPLERREISLGGVHAYDYR